ncbi:hypothetical protein TNCV_775761 [Trichonephila clavipes]|nr:hypothetical protein TNCV_775761 [Trichonephila clavipes]
MLPFETRRATGQKEVALNIWDEPMLTEFGEPWQEGRVQPRERTLIVQSPLTAPIHDPKCSRNISNCNDHR